MPLSAPPEKACILCHWCRMVSGRERRCSRIEEQSDLLGRESFHRGEQHFSEFNFRSFGLKCDIAFARRALSSMVDEIAIYPDLHAGTQTFDHHVIPFTDGLFGSICQV